MTQRTSSHRWRSIVDALRTRPSTPAGPAVAAELEAIVERRMAEPPPAGTVRPRIREYRPADRRALEEMTLRCSTGTLRRRFHGSVEHLPPGRIADLLGGRRGSDHLVAEVDGAIVGLASLHRRTAGDGEIAVLVEDAWQSTGLGHRLTAHLVRRAGDRHIAVLVADVLREPGFLVDRLGHMSAETTVEFDGPIATVRIPVASLARA